MNVTLLNFVDNYFGIVFACDIGYISLKFSIYLVLYVVSA